MSDSPRWCAKCGRWGDHHSDHHPEGTGQMDSPHAVMANLQAIEHELAERQNDYEEAARAHFMAQPRIKKAWATAMLTSTQKTVAEKRAEADLAALEVEGASSEAEYLVQKAVIDVLDKRGSINQSILKAHTRA